MKALNPAAAFWYTPRREEGQENATRFKIKGLNGSQQCYVAPELIFEGVQLVGISGKGCDYVLTNGLIDWENFENDAGPVACVPVNHSLIDYGTRIELAMQILSSSFISADEKKT